MNSEADMHIRLLKLFPVKELKENFETNATGDQLHPSIVNNVVHGAIRDFAYSNINSTKQHIYIYQFQNNYNLASFNPANFPYNVISRSNANGELQIVVSPIVEFRVILTNPFQEVILNFHQPFLITIRPTHLIFQATIMEKNMMSYFDAERQVVKVEKLNDEKIAIANILPYFDANMPIRCDLNRGVKDLWHREVIDVRFIKYMRDSSTDTTAMHEDLLLKREYPEDYERIINNPVNKTLFRYLLGDEQLPNHFTIDPTMGEISIPLFPTTQNQIPNVITQILSNN